MPSDIAGAVSTLGLIGESLGIGDQTPITYRPADDLAPELEKLRAEIPAGYLEQDEDVLSYALFDKVALKFFEYRKNQKYGIADTADFANGVHTV